MTPIQLRYALYVQFFLLPIAVILSHFFWPIGQKGLVAGIFLMVINLQLISWLVQRVYLDGQVSPWHMTLSLAKTLLMFALTVLTWFILQPHGLALVLGLATLPISLLLGYAWHQVRSSTIKPNL